MIIREKIFICGIMFLTISSFCNAITDAEGKTLAPRVEAAAVQVKALENKIGEGPLAGITSGILAKMLHGKKLVEHTDFSDIGDITKDEIESLLTDIEALNAGGPVAKVAGKDLSKAESIVSNVGKLKSAIPIMKNVIRKNLDVKFHAAVDAVVKLLEEATA